MIDTTASLLAQVATKVAAVPAVTDKNLTEVARALKSILDVREGKVGNPLDANVTYRDLVDIGAVALRPGWNARQSTKPVLPPWTDPDGYDPTQDFIPPPAPSNFTATGLFAMVQLQWDTPTYRNHAYAEVWRSETNAIGNALKIATTDTSFFADNLGTGATRYYWVRFVSQANVFGPYHGVDGMVATTATDPALVIASLQGQITESELYQTLGARINLIDASASVAGSVNFRVAAEAAARTQAIAAEAQARAAAIASEATTRSNAIQNEASTRAQEILTEALARSNADGALQTQINTLTAASSGDFQDLIAAVQEEQTARIAGDTAEALSRETLATQLRGGYTGTDPSQLSTGILFNERQARVSAEGVISSAVSALSATVSNNYNTLNAAITAEQIARTNADSAFTSSFTNLSATVATKNRTFYQSTAPTATATGDIWYDTANNNQAKRWSGSAWVATDDTRIAANAAAITTEQTARASADSALTTSITNLTTTVANNYNTLNSAITTEATARSDGDTALSNTLTALTATVAGKNKNYFQAAAPSSGMLTGDVWYDTDDNNKAYRYNGTAWVATDDTRIASNTAAITAEATARATADTAFTSTLNTLSSTVTNNYNTLNSAIINEASTRSTADATLSTQINTVSSVANGKNRTYSQTTAPGATGLVVGDIWFDTDDNNKAYRWSGSAWGATDDTRIAANAAAIVTEQNTRASADSSLATSITSLTSTINNNNTNLTAAIASESTTRANAVTALTNSINTLQATVTNNNSTLTASIQTEATTRASVDTGLLAQYTVKTDVNGYVSGFGLASTANNAAASSSFAVRADTFYIANPTGPSVAPAMPFIVRTTATTIGGVNVPVGVYISDAFIQNGTISNAKIASAAIDDAKIANLSAAKITTGFLSADRIQAGSLDAKIANIDAAVIGTGTINSARIGNLDASKITTGQLTADRINGANLTINASGVELGKDVGPGTGHFGLSLSDANFNNIFLKRNDGVVFFRVNEGGTNYITFDSGTGNLNIKSAGFSVQNGVVGFTGTVIDTSNIYNESVNIFKLARGASLPDYVRTYKGATTPTVTVNAWLALQLDAAALNNKIGAVDYDAYRTLLPAGTYFYELSVPVKCQGSDTNDAVYTAIISNPPGTPSGGYQTVCGYVWVGNGKDGSYEYQCWQEFVPTTYTVLSTSGVNVVGDWQTATIFGVGRFTLTTPGYISAAVLTTDGFPSLNVVARSGYSTTILRIWRDGNA
jgi:hypothetical protein